MGDAAADAAAPDAGPPDAGPDAAAPDAALAEDAAPALRDAGPPDADLPPCTPEPTAEALEPASENPGGPWLAPGGRRLSPAGLNVVVPGFSTSVLFHPARDVVYVTSASDDDRRLLVLDAATGEIRQDVERDEAFYGLALDADADRLYASAGFAGRVDAFAVQPDGTLVADGSIETGGYPAGLALDGGRLYVGLFNTPRVIEIDVATGEERARYPTASPVWDLLVLPARRELYASSLQGDDVSVIDLAAGALARTLPLPTSPAGMAADPAGTRLWVAVSGADVVVAVDPATGEVTATGHVAEDDLVDADGAPLPSTNVNALAYDAVRGRLYASRGADNAVSVLDADDLTLLGSIPTSWYPTDVALAGPDRLVVAEGKGGGAGPNRGEGVKQVMKGSVTFVELPGLDLAASTEQVKAGFRRAQATFPFQCDGRFPIPTRPG
ncbi:MAG: PQQ-binding-like beta-propeller repeat protein, partial [bacterium]